MSGQQGSAQQEQSRGVGFSSAVGVGNTHTTGTYNRSPGATTPAGKGAPNFSGYFKPRGTGGGNSNVSALTAGLSGLTMGQGKRKRKSRSKKSRKSRKTRKF